MTKIANMPLTCRTRFNSIRAESWKSDANRRGQGPIRYIYPNNPALHAESVSSCAMLATAHKELCYENSFDRSSRRAGCGDTGSRPAQGPAEIHSDSGLPAGTGRTAAEK